MQTLQDMLSASQQDLEAFLTQVYRAIAGAAPLKDKVRQIVIMPSSHLLVRAKMLELVWLFPQHLTLVEITNCIFQLVLLGLIECNYA